MVALMTSVRLWGGMLVAMPTAMPEDIDDEIGKARGQNNWLES